MVLDFDFFLLKDDKVIQAMADMVQDIVDKSENVIINNDFVSQFTSGLDKNLFDIRYKNGLIYNSKDYNMYASKTIRVSIKDGDIDNISTDDDEYYDNLFNDKEDFGETRDIITISFRDCYDNEAVYYIEEVEILSSFSVKTCLDEQDGQSEYKI